MPRSAACTPPSKTGAKLPSSTSSRSADRDPNARNAATRWLLDHELSGPAAYAILRWPRATRWLQQGPDGAAVVEGQRRQVAHPAVHEHQAALLGQAFESLVGAARRAEDQPVDLLLQAADHVGLDRRVLVGVGDEHGVAHGPGPGLDALADRAEEGVLEIRHDQADAAGLPGDEATGGAVRAVAHGAGHVLDPEPGLVRHLVRRGQRAGHGRDGDAGRAGHVPDRHRHCRHHLVRASRDRRWPLVASSLQTFVESVKGASRAAVQTGRRAVGRRARVCYVAPGGADAGPFSPARDVRRSAATTLNLFQSLFHEGDQ